MTTKRREITRTLRSPLSACARWLATTMVLLAITGCSAEDAKSEPEPAPQPTTQSSPAPDTTDVVSSQTIVATSVIGTANDPAGGLRLTHALDDIDVGWIFAHVAFPGPAVVAFSELPVSAECLVHVEMHIDLQPDQIRPVPIAAYRAHSRFLTMANGEVVPGQIELLANRPRGVFEFEATAGTADVTDLVAAYLDPTSPGTELADAPLAVTVQPESASDITTYTLGVDAPGSPATRSPSLRLDTRC